MSKIGSMYTKNKTANFSYKDTGFKTKLRLLQKDDIEKIQKDSTVVVFDEEIKADIDTLDDTLIAANMAKACVLGWEGLTYEVLATILPVDEDSIEDWSEEIPYTPEDAAELIEHSAIYQTWVVERTRDLETFRRFQNIERNRKAN